MSTKIDVLKFLKEGQELSIDLSYFLEEKKKNPFTTIYGLLLCATAIATGKDRMSRTDFVRLADSLWADMKEIKDIIPKDVKENPSEKEV